MPRAIVCGSGGYRVVFIQGVLSAFESAGFRADAYAGTSASVMPAACAAVAQSNSVGLDYWKTALEFKEHAERGMSDVMLSIIDEWGAFIRERLFQEGMPRFVLPVSAVKTGVGAAQTQSKEARRLGRQLLLAAARRQASPWVAENLELHLYDTAGGKFTLTPENFDAAAYASTRMMHAWDVPAEINGKPYVDASYLCAIPAVEMAELGYDEVIAISADPPGKLYRDIFGTREVPEVYGSCRIHILMPEVDPGSIGADFTDGTPEGLEAAYHQGQIEGQKFLDNYRP